MNSAQSERMKCMEIWGGNRAADRDIEMTGLRVWAYSKPYAGSDSGGDVYFLTSCASGRISRMLLADVSGHGEEVSKIALGLRDLMRRNVSYISQSRFVKGMNEQFSQLNVKGEFATALVSTFFAPTGSYSLCNAGHPPPLLRRSADQQWTELSDRDDHADVIADIPLGVSDQAAYFQHHVRLEPGDLVLSFSDAITEAEDADGQQLGCEGVLQLVSELPASDPAGLIPALVARIGELDPQNLERDDTTILLCQATGGGPPMKNNLLAPLRMIAGVTDKTEIM